MSQIENLSSLPYYFECCDIIEGIIQSNVNFIALDFDDTLIDIHTHGQWNGSSSLLIEHVRPFFKTFLRVAYNKVYIAIVTFSSQTQLISDVLHEILPPDVAHKIPIRGEDQRWDYVGKGSRDGKQKHMASAAEYLQSCYDVTITRATSLLIDDQIENIQIALQQGVRAVRFDPKNPEQFNLDMQQLFPLG